MNGAMRLSIDEVLNEAIMSSTPVIIVEGIDDLKIYTSVAKSVLKKCEVYPVETINGYSAGCNHVIAAIRDLYNLNDSIHPIENFVLGVIDRDAREFRDELPSEAAIFALDYYSMESHFVCEEVFFSAIRQHAKVHSDKLGPNFSAQLFSKIEKEMLDLYYFSLEALQCALDPSYKAEFKYSSSHDKRLFEPIRSNVLAKKAQLDQLADRFNLKPDLESLKKITQGKCLLSAFSKIVYMTLCEFTSYCGKFGSEQCEFCRNSITNKCTFRIKDGVTDRTLYSYASENTTLACLDYIRQRISSISLQTLPAN